MPAATVTVHSHLQLDVRQLGDDLRLDLQQQLTRANPDRLRAQARGRPCYQLPAMVHLWEQRGQHLLLPRGAVQLLRQRAAAHGVALLWSSEVVSRSTQQVPLGDLPLELRSYQRDGVQALLRGVQGYLRAPCGSGKTVMGASALVASGEPGLVLVHTLDLLEQWAGLLRGWDYRVRVVAGGRMAGLGTPLRVRGGVPEFAVATVRTLTQAGAQASTLLRSCGAVLLDEAHHAPASTFSGLLQQLPARYRWGVTATPEREDGWTFALPLVIGPELWRVEMQELVRAGHLLRPQLLRVHSGARLDIAAASPGGQLQIARAVNQLASDRTRQQLLLDLCQLLAERGRTVLLLVPRVQQAHRLAQALGARGVVSLAVTSRVGKGLRQQRLAQVRAGQVQVLVATQLADEGLDVPGLDALVLASTGRAAGRAVQRLGRVMRVAEGKGDSLVVDVVDPTPFGGRLLRVRGPTCRSWGWWRRL